LKIHIEIFNTSRQTFAPANFINLVMVPGEIQYPEGSSGQALTQPQEETILTVPSPSHTSRIMTFGFSLPAKVPQSATFEIQTDPQDGEKETGKWEES
jgi:hypothetical protein